MNLKAIELCECGCGTVVKIGVKGKLNKFVYGHNGRGMKRSEETKCKISTAKMGHLVSKEQREKQSKTMTGRPGSFLGCKHTEETKQKIRIAGIGKKNALGHTFTPTEEWKKQNSERMLGNQYAVGERHSPTEERKEEASKRMKELWADPIYHKAASKRLANGSQRDRPNKAEIQLLELLESIQPGDWKYIGDGTLVVAGKNPDFVNTKGEKLIELFGDYWHEGQDPKKRVAIFTPHGYKTLVVWQHELKDQPKLTKRITNFAA